MGHESFVAGIGGAWPKHDRGYRHLTPRRIRARDHRGVRDAGVRQEDGFDLGRSDVQAATDDPVGPPVHDRQASVAIQTTEVAGP